MTRRRVRFTATARRHLLLFKQWWRENSERPEILDQDLEEALGLISVAPAIGALYRIPSVPGARRIYLKRITAHLYYTYDWQEVIIRALWHARRGSGPRLDPG